MRLSRRLLRGLGRLRISDVKKKVNLYDSEVFFTGTYDTYIMVSLETESMLSMCTPLHEVNTIDHMCSFFTPSRSSRRISNMMHVCLIRRCLLYSFIDYEHIQVYSTCEHLTPYRRNTSKREQPPVTGKRCNAERTEIITPSPAQGKPTKRRGRSRTRH